MGVVWIVRAVVESLVVDADNPGVVGSTSGGTFPAERRARFGNALPTTSNVFRIALGACKPVYPGISCRKGGGDE